MEQTKFKVVEYLDEPERILFFTIDEFLSFIIPMGVGLGSHHSGFGLLIGLLGLFFIKKFKANDGGSFLQRLMYWYLPLKFGKLKYTPPSYLRDFIG